MIGKTRHCETTVDGQNIQTLQCTSWWPPATKSQCFTVHHRASKCGAKNGLISFHLLDRRRVWPAPSRSSFYQLLFDPKLSTGWGLRSSSRSVDIQVAQLWFMVVMAHMAKVHIANGVYKPTKLTTGGGPQSHQGFRKDSPLTPRNLLAVAPPIWKIFAWVFKTLT
jgi:hypothetical protein